MLKVFMLFLLCKTCIIFYIILTNFSFNFDFCFGLSKLATVITKKKVMQRKLVLILRNPNIPKRLLLGKTQQY